jgi:ubiquitin carboxyl-terminal hydrolase L5
MEGGGWCTIESDPGVFTEMMSSVGVHGAEVVEVITLADEATLQSLEPIYGFVFLFKWTGKAEKPKCEDPMSTGVYFAKQTVQNACATQAILNILLNKPSEVALGETLTEFLTFTESLDPFMRGDMIGQHDLIRTVHNSFTRSQCFSFEQKDTKDDKEDVYHFVAYIHKFGSIWELDGLQPGPIKHMECDVKQFVPNASKIIQDRMERVAQSDTSGTGQGISFNLMAVIEDRVAKFQKLGNAEALADLLAEREKQRLENIRRRHNYIPTIVALLKALAKKGKLAPILETYKNKAKERALAAGEGNK